MAVMRSTTAKILTALAWVATLALAIVDIYFVRQIFLSILARFRPDYFAGVWWTDAVVMISAVLVLIYVLVSGEYYFKHAGEEKAWFMLGRTFVVLLLIPILAYFM